MRSPEVQLPASEWEELRFGVVWFTGPDRKTSDVAWSVVARKRRRAEEADEPPFRLTSCEGVSPCRGYFFASRNWRRVLSSSFASRMNA